MSECIRSSSVRLNGYTWRCNLRRVTAPSEPVSPIVNTTLDENIRSNHALIGILNAHYVPVHRVVHISGTSAASKHKTRLWRRQALPAKKTRGNYLEQNFGKKLLDKIRT